jgi:hypothetical protein
MTSLERLTLRESREEPRVIQRAAALLGVSDNEVVALFTRAAARLRDLLNFRRSPFDIQLTGAVRVDGIAGLLRLSPHLEIEVVPKFLDAEEETWQEDFFQLALFSQTGRMLPREQVRAGHADRGDLATLVGRTLSQMYWENHRRPVRTYRQKTLSEYSVDGDVDPLDLLLPEAEGFQQQVLQLSRNNDYNAVIASAVRVLLPEIRDAETRKQLLRVGQALEPQPAVHRPQRQRLPARHSRWQATYDLSYAVLQGFGVGFNAEHLLAPGFVLRTWTTWQALVESAIRAGLPSYTVLGQATFTLGKRGTDNLLVTPDVVINNAGAPRLVVDAKYRTREGAKPTINASDVYETLAFLRGTGTTRAVLLYPRPSSQGAAQTVGTATEFERVEVGAELIVGMEIESRGISDGNAYETFATTLAEALKVSLL